MVFDTNELLWNSKFVLKQSVTGLTQILFRYISFCFIKKDRKLRDVWSYQVFFGDKLENTGPLTKDIHLFWPDFYLSLLVNLNSLLGASPQMDSFLFGVDILSDIVNSCIKEDATHQSISGLTFNSFRPLHFRKLY